ncbi:hypothetical protein [Salipiger mucosus]|uniref:Uncharacterized protein n=1 Tax=Salipiger mucosus DSM 16094 TaxID=1123237 RepID=S9QWT0_9RHOB|nr:hypothetical protein [Salipiger mucosus]EPX84037.1 hypothetical protein Salmuc_01812 [Salipiger mucosus DSM 16094]
MSKTTKDLVADVYARHKENLIAETMDTNGGIALVVSDLERKPAHVRVLAFDEEKKRLDSFGFLENNRMQRQDLRLQKVKEQARKLADAGEARSSMADFQPYPASDSIRDFGLFGKDPEIGEVAFSAFETRVRSELDRPDADAVLENFQKDKFVAAETRRLRKPLADFGVDPIHKDAVRVLDALDTYDWKTLRFYGGDDERGLYRRQAAEIYPLLADFFAHNSSFSRQVIQKQKPLNAELAKVFGVKEKSLKRLRGVAWNTNGLSVSEIVDHASAIPPDWFPKDEDEWNAFTTVSKTIGRRLKNALGELTDRPLDVLYKGSKGQWQEFHRRCAQAFMDTRPPQGIDPDFEKQMKETIDWKKVEKAAKRGDEDYRSAVGRQLSKLEFSDQELRDDVRDWMLGLYRPDMSEHNLQTAVDQTMEMVEFVRNHVVMPAAATAVTRVGNIDDICIAGNQFHAARNTAMQLLFMPDLENPSSGKTAPNIFENTRYYLNDLARITANTIGDGLDVNSLQSLPEGHWPRLFGGNPQAPNGIYFESLTCTDELVAEGNNGRNADGTEGLRHCVGGYTHQCQSGFQHIVSLRRACEIEDPRTGQRRQSFQRLATVQFDKIENFSRPLKRRQFYAVRDTRPTDDMRAALEWFEQSVRAEDLALNQDQIQEYMAANGEIVMLDEVEGICGYKWKEPENINNAMMAVGRLVHRAVTKDVRSIDDLVQHPVLKPTVGSIDPIYGATMHDIPDRPEPEPEAAADAPVM